MRVNSVFLEKAKALKPTIYEKEVLPVGTVRLLEDQGLRLGWKACPEDGMENFYTRAFHEDDEVVLDFGEHLVGYLNLWFETADNHADAPLRLRLTFGELPCDTAISPETFKGGNIGRGWLQTEVVTIDVVPGMVRLPRRYAFRYVRMMIEGLSPFYSVRFPKITATAVTSADESRLLPLPEGTDPYLVRLDDAGVRTLRDCMQSTVEDGPKRDRRYWTFVSGLGMKANHYTYRNYDMAKRLLYLQAAFQHDDGNGITCVYVEPEYEAGHEHLEEHASAFIFDLKEYVDTTGDEEVLAELWHKAVQQMHLTASRLQPDGLIDVSHFSAHWSNADKQMYAQCYVICCLREYLWLAERQGDGKETAYAEESIRALTEAVRRELYDTKLQLYVSGPNRQVSWRNQICAAVSGVAQKQEVEALFDRTAKYPDCYPIESTTTYALLIQALIDCGQKERALEVLKEYFGAMLDEGADTYFEHFNLGFTFPCKYHHILMDSYCHSCQAIVSYFIRKYFV